MKKNRYYELLRPPDIKCPLNWTTRMILPACGMDINSLRGAVGKNGYSGEDLLKLLNFKSAYSYFPECPDKWEREIF